MKYHLSLYVRGALNWKGRMLRGMFRKEDGSLSTAQETREILMEELSKGHECLPMMECDNFDYKTGCKGHPEEVSSEEMLARQAGGEMVTSHE